MLNDYGDAVAQPKFRSHLHPDSSTAPQPGCPESSTALGCNEYREGNEIWKFEYKNADDVGAFF